MAASTINKKQTVEIAFNYGELYLPLLEISCGPKEPELPFGIQILELFIGGPKADRLKLTNLVDKHIRNDTPLNLNMMVDGEGVNGFDGVVYLYYAGKVRDHLQLIHSNSIFYQRTPKK